MPSLFVYDRIVSRKHSYRLLINLRLVPFYQTLANSRLERVVGLQLLLQLDLILMIRLAFEHMQALT